MSNLTNNKQALFGTKSGGGASKPQSSASSASKESSSPVTASLSVVPPSAPQSKTAGMTFKASSSGNTMSAEARQSKINEAHSYFVKGEENLKTSFFQWKPDHLSAASNFEKASELFKAADQPKRAIKTLLMAADNYELCSTLSSAAMNRMKAAELAKEIGDQEHCLELIEKSAETWGIYGDLQKYGETLEKLGKEVRNPLALYVYFSNCLFGRHFLV
jgi:hypothetical protein